MRGRSGVWTQGYHLSTARILPWTFRESDGTFIGEEEIHIRPAHEASRSRGEFGAWVRSDMKEKLISGSYVLRLAYSTAVKLTHPVEFPDRNRSNASARLLLGMRVVCRTRLPQLLLEISFVDTPRSCLLHVCLRHCIHVSEGNMPLAVPFLAAKMCLWEVSSCLAWGGTSIPDLVTQTVENLGSGESWKRLPCTWGGNSFLLTDRKTRGKQGALVARESPSPSPLSFLLTSTSSALSVGTGNVWPVGKLRHEGAQQT